MALGLFSLYKIYIDPGKKKPLVVSKEVQRLSEVEWWLLLLIVVCQGEG